MKKWAGLVMAAIFTFLFFSIFLVTQLEPASAQQLRIKYDYQYGRGSFGIYGIADTATAFVDDQMVAEAHALRIIEKRPGPNQLEVEETHYSPSGRVVYRGRLIFRFSGSGGRLEEQIPISGTKRNNFFSSWPAGN